MKRNTIMSDVELSYQELKGLEKHFKQIKNDAVVNTLKNVSETTLNPLRGCITHNELSAEQRKGKDALRHLDTDLMRWTQPR